MNQIQQGDVIFYKVSELPVLLTKQDHDIVQTGESTHKHRLTEGEIYIEPVTKTKYLRVVREAEIVHEEHNKVTLPKGLWRVGIVREKGMFDDLVAPVVD